MTELVGRVAALDVGDVWTGVAISDATRRIARPLSVVGSPELVVFLSDVIASEGLSRVIVGVPRTLRGEVGYQARRVLDTLDVLRGEFPDVEFVEWDERFTTKIAGEIEGAPLRRPAAGGTKGSKGGKRKKRRGTGPTEGRLDHFAAARMLQEYLESRGNI